MRAPARLFAAAAGAALLPSLAWSAPPRADLVLYNGRVLTVDKAFSIRRTVVVKDGRILAVGGDQLARRYQARARIDLHGRTLMPGFTDTHLHLYGLSHREIDMSKARSIADIQGLIREKSKALGPGEWITGYGWSEAELAEKRRPLRADLDAAAPDNPVALIRAGHHSTVGNSRALQVAGIDRSTPEPEGGVIERGGDGEPNGVIRERGDLFERHIPHDSPQQMRPGYIRALKALLPLGITSFMEALTTLDDEPVGKGGRDGVPAGHTYRQFRSIYDELGPELPRVTLYIAYPGEERLRQFPHHTGYGDDRLRLGPIGETPVDGGFTGPTAYTTRDYKGQPGFRGRIFYTRDQLQRIVDVSASLGWQLGLHAIGDAAIIETVGAYDAGLRKLGPGEGRRWFLSHFTMMPPEATMTTMGRDRIMIAQQPNFTYTLEGRYEDNLTDDQVDGINSVATPRRHGIFVAFGSDNLPIDPRVGLYAAVTRKGMSGRAHGAGEIVSRRDAIRMYTANGPYLTFEEKQKGTLEPGKLADMIVLDRDPLSIPADDLLTLKVDLTIVGGRIVYDRTAAEAAARP